MISPQGVANDSLAYLYNTSWGLNESNLSGQEPPVFPPYIRVLAMVFCSLILGIGVVGNVMVPLVIIKTKDMRNSTNIFLMNLSIADLMVLLVCTPTVLVELNSKPDTWILGEEMCKAVPFVELTVAHASVLTILAISFERYYAICEPLRAGYVCTKARAILICLLAWAFAALFTSPATVMAEYSVGRYDDGSLEPACLTIADSFWKKFFFFMIISIFFVFPLGVLIVLYAVIARHLMADSGTSHSGEGCNQRARKQVVLMLGTVVLSFFLCLLPFKVFTLWVIVNPSTVASIGPESYYALLYFCRVMHYLNSAVNPILYNLMSSKFRQGFRRLVGAGRGGMLLTRDRPTLTTTLSHSSARLRGSPDLSWRNGSVRRNVILRSSLLRGELTTKLTSGANQHPESNV